MNTWSMYILIIAGSYHHDKMNNTNLGFRSGWIYIQVLCDIGYAVKIQNY